MSNLKLEYSDLTLPQTVEMVVLSAFERCKTTGLGSFAETKVNLPKNGMTMKIRVECDPLDEADGGAA